MLMRGYGVADVESRRPMNPESTIVRIGSISKVMTAFAVAQLVDRGRMKLDIDVNQYLRSVKIPSNYPQPITPWHLLTHSAALDEIRPGTQAETREGIQSLSDFLRTRLVRYAPPGAATAYSTYGMTVGGLLVEEVSGQRFERYMRDNVWSPLGMRLTSIDVPAAQSKLVAVGYDVENNMPVRARWEWYHTTPASSVNSTAADMARYMIAQLVPNEAVMSERMTRQMQRQQITMHPRLPGWGLGWQMIRVGDTTAVQHGGDVAGFSSLMTVLPVQNFGIFVGGHREGSDARLIITRTVLQRFFPSTKRVAPVVSMHSSMEATMAALKRYVGVYRANIVCHTCANARPAPEIEVVANDDGTLSMLGAKYVEVSARYFRSVDGAGEMGFREDESGRITHMTLGSWQVLERVR
jgi:CubicO group peptidase (beta-lactamase class C family)